MLISIVKGLRHVGSIFVYFVADNRGVFVIHHSYELDAEVDQNQWLLGYWRQYASKSVVGAVAFVV